jgi:hypothetical protein
VGGGKIEIFSGVAPVLFSFVPLALGHMEIFSGLVALLFGFVPGLLGLV